MNAVDTLNNKLDAIDHHLKSQKNIITQVEPMLGDVEDLIEQLEKKYNIYNP